MEVEKKTVKTPDALIARRLLTEQKLQNLVSGLTAAKAPEIAEMSSSCVYATGSLGRGEMSERSDLDIFLLRDKKAARPLTNLDEIRLAARLVDVAQEQGYPEFSGDGKYIKAHDVQEDLIGKLGTSEDDYANVFTARMLLVLESRPVLGTSAYERALDSVIAEYWRDYTQNSRSFLPIFLSNDILRFWKTLCLNYEERTGREAGTKAGKRRLHNYKLKHSRLLTCYSAIIYMLTILRRDNGTVSPEAVMEMIAKSPTARLEWVAEQVSEVDSAVQAILDNYSKFLDTCNAEKASLEERFSEPEFKRERFAEAKQFGDEVFRLLHSLGEDTALLRYLVV